MNEIRCEHCGAVIAYRHTNGSLRLVTQKNQLVVVHPGAVDTVCMAWLPAKQRHCGRAALVRVEIVEAPTRVGVA